MSEYADPECLQPGTDQEGREADRFCLKRGHIAPSEFNNSATSLVRAMAVGLMEGMTLGIAEERKVYEDDYIR